jgi:hypothetical protein
MPLDFVPASSQSVDLGLSIPSLNAKPAATVMGWVNPDAFGSTRSLTEQAIGPPPGTSGTSRILFNINSTGTLVIGARAADGGGINTLTTVAVLATGVWSHIVGVVNVAGDLLQVYINGVLSASTASAFGPVTFSATNSKNGRVGADDPGTGQFFDGRIEDYRMYDRALSLAEVQTIYASRGTDGICNGLVQSWRLNEGAPGVAAVGVGTVKDSSPAQRNVNPINSPVYQPGTVRYRRKVA